MILYLLMAISVLVVIYGWLIYKRKHTPYMAKATVEALAALELTGKGVDDMVDDISYSIDDAFAKIGTTVAP